MPPCVRNRMAEEVSRVLGTLIFVHENGAWRAYRGPVFVNQAKAERWAAMAVENEAANGSESVAGVWEHATGNMVYETRVMRLAA